MGNQREEICKELRELTEAAALLPDDRVYTAESYHALVQAVAYAKVFLARENASEDTLRGALAGLGEAIDGLELREEDKKQKDFLHQALPYLLGGALLCGAAVGGKLARMPLKKKLEKCKKQAES